MKETKPTTQAYPAPTIVVGIGRFGLASLEELGASWRALADGGADATLANLRLLHVKAEVPGRANQIDADADPAWRRSEAKWAEIAEFIGTDDAPALAVDFVLLRTLGLVRYRNGSYEVAVPRDHGFLEAAHQQTDDRPGVQQPAAASATTATTERPPARRIRTFEWRELHPDPLVACDTLRLKLQREFDLAEFVSPLLKRIKRGHSPEIVLHLVTRYARLADGLDMSPWPWQPDRLQGSRLKELRSQRPVVDLLSPEERRALETRFDGFQVLPLRGQPAHRVQLLRSFRRDAEALSTPLDPIELLLQPWETPGWTTKGDTNSVSSPYWVLGREESYFSAESDAQGDDAVNEVHRRHAVGDDEIPSRNVFSFVDDDGERVDYLPFLLGLYDDDQRGFVSAAADTAVADEVAGRIEGQLKTLAVRLLRGLYGLFLDMRLGKLVEPEVPVHEDQSLRDADVATEQSIDILAEFLIRPWDKLKSKYMAQSTVPPPPTPEAFSLGSSPSRTLTDAVVPADIRAEASLGPLERRLRSLGADDGTKRAVKRLFTSVALAPDDLAGASSGDRGGMLALRRSLAHQAADLLAAHRQNQYRQNDEKRPPRMTVFLIGDLGEPFVRATIQHILGTAHAELLRSFGPIFSAYRVGFDRTLSIIPVLWTAHPGGSAEAGARALESATVKPHAGTTAQALRNASREEGAILDSLFNLRRRIDQMLQGERCVPLLYLSARVTECALLSVRDSIRQTHDFLSLIVRHPLGEDPWLANLVVGPSGRDILSTFVCLEAEFPALSVREYLAARLGRNVARGLVTQGMHAPMPTAAASLGVLPMSGESARTAVTDACERRGAQMADEARAPLHIDDKTPPAAIAAAWGPSLVDSLRGGVARAWRDLTATSAGMDEHSLALRVASAGALTGRVRELEHAHDEIVGRVGSALTARDVELVVEKDATVLGETARDAERSRRAAEARCLSQGIPDSSFVKALAEAVQAAGARKLEYTSVLFATGLVALLGFAAGGPIVDGVFAALGLGDSEVGRIARVRAAPFIASALFGGVAAAVLVWLLRRSTRRVVDAIDALAERLNSLVAGADGSMLSFLDARIDMTLALFQRATAAALGEVAQRDRFAAQRMTRSARALEHSLRRRTEELGARPARSDDGTGPVVDDLDALLRTTVERDPLTTGAEVDEFYRESTRNDPRAEGHRAPLVECAGDVSHWRRQASFSRVADVLAHGRRFFHAVVDEPIHTLPVFAAGVARRRREFVQTHRASFGLSTGFIGNEGSDTDGVRVLANGVVLAAAGEPAVDPRTPQRSAPIRPSAIYLVSVAQGIAPETASGFVRMQSSHERAAFPGAPQAKAGEKVHAFTGFEKFVEELHPVLRPENQQPLLPSQQTNEARPAVTSTKADS